MASLSGRSRSKGKSNWDGYIVDEWQDIQHRKLVIEEDGTLYTIKNSKPVPMGPVKSGTELQILSPEVITISNTQYAHINIQNNIGYIPIKFIKKPSGKGSPNPNSKEYTPDKINLNGIHFKTIENFISTIKTNFKAAYNDEKYDNIFDYCEHCVDIISKHTGQKPRTEKINLSKNFIISDHDLKILSKNFGEVLAGLYIQKTNKDITSISFPSDISQQLFDFSGTHKDKTEILYSVKAAGGSSTTLDNINLILKIIPTDTPLLTTYKNEISVIQSLINNKKLKITTLSNIENFYNTLLLNKKIEILKILNKEIKPITIASLSQADLSKWFTIMKKKNNPALFIQTLTNVYTNVLENSTATLSTLEWMYQQNSSTTFKNGYLYYPMGSYIVKYLNKTGNYQKVLTSVLNMGNNVTQVTVNLTNKDMSFNIKEFSKGEFQFYYNSMAKSPDNRPIGFKMK